MSVHVTYHTPLLNKDPSTTQHCQPKWKFSANNPSPDVLKIGSWNVRGWSLDPAQQLRPNTVKALNLDIICVNETFLLEEQETQPLLHVASSDLFRGWGAFPFLEFLKLHRE